MNGHEQTPASQTSIVGASYKQLVLGTLFGIVFGFLLQKGGVAKFHILIGVLILEDFTVIKVMLSAILVGMIGIWIMHRMGLVELHVKPTRYAGNIIGGLVFGAGFALAAYCPGTGAAAFGQGNYDALAVMIGMMAGSVMFAEVSERANRFASRWGERGKMLWPDAVHVPPGRFIGTFAVLLLLILVGLDYLPGWTY